ncbi:MAG TPA: nitrogen regulation protein NR(I) [Thermopetrobacter sp.]|nr:nitrogen regulation protein NR(I) [Thermopetrobacter sp.]
MSGDEHTIMVVDDDTSVRTVLTRALTRAGYRVVSGSTAAAMWQMVSAGEGDVLITDVVLPDEDAFTLLPRIREKRPELPVVVMSARNTIMTAITAAEKGAFEYLPKPFDLNEMLNVVRRALEQASQPRDAGAPRQPREQLPLIGRSRAMQDIYRIIARMTQTDLTVMIYGESGTGKELVARVLHDFGKRRNGPFVALNMAAIPRELIESELFGHEKGAFTGAAARKSGHFEQARGGTLFLDEIGDMPMEAQTRLLRVLQEGEFTTVGGSTPIKADVRIIAATHRNLKQMIAAGRFREDLYFRLNVVPVRLPPLRERVDDIPDLVGHFLQTAEEGGVKRFTPEAIARLLQHAWPGNVRELENLVRRIAAIYSEEEIGPDIIEKELSETSTSAIADAAAASLGELVEKWIEGHFARHGEAGPPPGLYDRVIREVETPLISAALAFTGGNQVKAAQLLGINRNPLRSRIRDLGLTVMRTGRAMRR